MDAAEIALRATIAFCLGVSAILGGVMAALGVTDRSSTDLVGGLTLIFAALVGTLLFPKVTP